MVFIKILVFGDCHWSTYSSILRKRGNLFSYRLENLIKSINWVEEQAINNDVNLIVGLGDFFDKETLNSEEITALTKINWSDIRHCFIIGNHEIGRQDLFYSSTKIFNEKDFFIVDKCMVKFFFETLTNIVFLPYTLTPNSNILETISKNCNKENKTIIFSHNDIAGIQLGQYISKSGFEIEDIENSCDLFINGHLHNGTKITDKIINLGNLTGQNFSEDANKYSHNIMILDTDTLEYSLIENPFAINFYKLDVTSNEIDLHSLKNNSVITLKCFEKDVQYWKNRIDNCSNIIENRILIEKNIEDKEEIKNDLTSSDHIEEFKKYVITNIGSTDLILDELLEVCK